MKLYYFIYLYIMLFALIPSSLQAEDQRTIDSLLKRLNQAQDDSNKVNLYIALIKGHIYFNTEDGYKYEDPALRLAQKINMPRGIYTIKAWAGRLYWRIGRFDVALLHHKEALKLAEAAADKKNIWLILTFIGQDYADQSLYPEAIRYFTKALKIAQSADDKDGIAQEYSLLAWVYNRTGNFPKAIQYQYKQLKLFEQGGKELEAARTLLGISNYQESIGNDSIAEVLRNKAWPILKKSTDNFDLITVNEFLGDQYLQEKKFHEALKHYEFNLNLYKKMNDKSMLASGYYSIAKVYRELGKDTVALRNLFLAAENFEKIFSTENVASMYLEIGSCYIRLKKYVEARKYFDKAYPLLEKIDNESTKADYLGSVEVLDSALGNWKNAYLNYKLYVRYRERMSNSENASKTIRVSMQYDFDKKEAAAKAEQEKRDIMQSNIRNSITIGLVGALIFLVVVYRQRNKISKARKRSDELLLNILPAETAEELKATGGAEAKQFDVVTVMFTDFKNFTQVSEKMNAKELVNEINYLFSEFDHITSKYSIEKIKTIGDSYMCAGGLPVPNTTNAIDIVNAAIEIQQFMKQHLQQRTNEGKEVLEIRIGVHTGPVVAGIVGIKKFAYDIWGDTVNIASGMESSGEAGKINISGATYELVKNQFQCTYRGKIQAKNKGEIDMYFVENISDSGKGIGQ